MSILPRDKQIEIIAALTEGMSIRSVERLTGIHRDKRAVTAPSAAAQELRFADQQAGGIRRLVLEFRGHSRGRPAAPAAWRNQLPSLLPGVLTERLCGFVMFRGQYPRALPTRGARVDTRETIFTRARRRPRAPRPNWRRFSSWR
jgi:hypothetical protein